ncbi:MAG: hypothetical protein WBL55_16965 [Xanthobacteraceae bacterium]
MRLRNIDRIGMSEIGIGGVPIGQKVQEEHGWQWADFAGRMVNGRLKAISEQFCH